MHDDAVTHHSLPRPAVKLDIRHKQDAFYKSQAHRRIVPGNL